jgi:type VI secretion system protein ImpK
MSPQPNVRRAENLALIFQEVLTAIERLRASRQGVSDAQAFRKHTRDALRAAANQALAAGYTADYVKFATFVAVAFLDESVLNSQNPIFADWLRKPLQEELFGTHIAGEVVFQNLDQLLTASDSPDLADLLEVHHLCLLLGFCGKYSAGNRGELAHRIQMVAEKIRRIRGQVRPLSPAWSLPEEKVRSMRDPWVRRLGIMAVVAAVVMALAFVGYTVGLHSGVSDVRAAGAQLKG